MTFENANVNNHILVPMGLIFFEQAKQNFVLYTTVIVSDFNLLDSQSGYGTIVILSNHCSPSHTYVTIYHYTGQHP